LSQAKPTRSKEGSGPRRRVSQLVPVEQKPEVPPLILVVDDDAEGRRVCAEILGRAGLRVEEAVDGFMAIAQARNLRPAVIVMDFHMPGMDGWGASRHLKSDPDLPSIPIIALTGDSHFETVVGAMDAGCDVFLSKPVTAEQLLAAVQRALRTPPADPSTGVRGRP
jgi:CheY-like chemotaxis protein